MDNCKGCEVFSTDGNDCIFRSFRCWSVKKCPCRECLIKMMCKDPCEPYVKQFGIQTDKRERFKNVKEIS